MGKYKALCVGCGFETEAVFCPECFDQKLGKLEKEISMLIEWIKELEGRIGELEKEAKVLREACEVECK